MNLDTSLKVITVVVAVLGAAVTAWNVWTQRLAVRSAGVYLRTAELLYQQADRARDNRLVLSLHQTAELEKRLRSRAVRAQLEAAALLEVPLSASRWVANWLIALPVGLVVVFALVAQFRYFAAWAPAVVDTCVWLLSAASGIFFLARTIAIRSARWYFYRHVEVPELWYQATGFRDLRRRIGVSRVLYRTALREQRSANAPEG